MLKLKQSLVLKGYQFLMLALLPVFFLRLWWRSRDQYAYRQYWSERLARYPDQSENHCRPVWIHAVSVGETRASVPLIAALKARWPDKPILLTHTTPTGRETGETVFGDSVSRCYLPYDFPGAMKRFLEHYQPEIGLMMETEIWPGIVASCNEKGIPICLLSGRLSARSAGGYRRLGKLIRDAFAGLNLVCAQTDADAKRFQELGSNHIEITGNLKFDAPVESNEIARSQILRTWLGINRPIFLAASTREGEEALILEAWKKHKLHESEQLLVIVPRHPQRFHAVAQMIDASHLRYVRKTEMPNSQNTEHAPELDRTVKVVLGDTMGEMPIWYRASDLAYIGGSLLPLGGQNLLEACARACPVIVGPHTFNFKQATEEALAFGAVARVESATHLMELTQKLLTDPIQRKQMGSAGLAFVARHQGATQRTLKHLEAFIKSTI
jgi:3-deoxy-D-manno-octulosonic-acid transferase